MGDIDPDTLLEWLTIGQGEERDMQLIALEQLCMLLLMSDNVDRCFESCPPRTFIPALCHIFMDDTAPDNILEVTARAITDYLDVSAECSRRIVSVDGAVKALCNRLLVTDISSRTSKDLAEQVVKLLELMCTREAGALYDAGGLGCMLTFIREYGSLVHKDTLHSAMSVVARLCTKIEPTDSTLEECVESLSKLLENIDSYVADGALRCFACLSDRFARKNVDPTPLAQHGLTDALLVKLGDLAVSNADHGQNLSASSSDTGSSGNISIIVSVLSTLCRGSATITHSLLRSNLVESISKAMKGDERCLQDTMRLVDLLLILLFEGREALPKSSFGSRSGLVVFNQMDGSGDRSHRQLIDCIRSKDTDALIDAVESGNFEVDFMDDVGQTLLNWASAFGTLEMVEFLCDRSADVNRGQRSSSLHYAACFGRPAVAKVLLRCGANPELRDEDGKTPLDKARERNDDGHKEVALILQSPGDYLASPSEKQEAQNKTKDNDKKIEGAEEVIKGDPEMAPIYLKSLLPIFARTFLSTLSATTRKSSLSVVKKIIHYIPTEIIDQVIPDHATASQLAEVIASVLSNEDDIEGHGVVFECLEDLMIKGKELFGLHFIRLGVLNTITIMASAVEPSGDCEVDCGKIKPLVTDGWVYDDASSINLNEPYHWNDWCIVRGTDCLYLWSEFCAIELSNGSNGWFRFILDGKLATMYSSGSPEMGSGSSESRSEFLEKLQKAISQVQPNAVSRPILSEPGTPKIIVGNWSFDCKKEKNLLVHNADGQQTTVLKEELCGFVFESNRGTKHTFTAETPLGTDFVSTWNSKAGKKFQSKKDLLKQKLSLTASQIISKYFSNIESIAVGNMAKLREVSEKLNELLQQDKYSEMSSVLSDLCELLTKEAMLSSFEIQSSGLVSALMNCLNKANSHSRLGSTSELQSAKDVFKSVFGGKASAAASSGDDAPAVVLVRKLVAVFEAVERLPVLTLDNSVNSGGLQVLLRRLRFRLERNQKSNTLIDHSGRLIKMEPLTTVGELQSYLSKMFAKQWHDFDRGSFKFVQDIKATSTGNRIKFSYESDFDENGLFYWIGTNGRTATDWVNPARYGVVVVSCSCGRSLPYGKPEAILSRDASILNCHTNDDKNSWFAIDLALWFIPNAYTLRHSRGYGRSALRNWELQASTDGQEWVTIKEHENDEALNEPGSTMTWQLDLSGIETPERGWRIFRIQQAGTNASGKTHYLSLCGLEFYGKITDVCVDSPKSCLPEDSDVRLQRHLSRTAMLRYMALDCKDGTNWKLAREQTKKSSGNRTEEFRKDSEGWVEVSSALNRLGRGRGVTRRRVHHSSGGNSRPALYDDIDQLTRRDLGNSMTRKAIRKPISRPRGPVPSDTLKSSENSLKRSNSSDVVEQVLTFGSENNERNSDVQDTLTRKVTDMANFRLLLAVEDLLDNASSELVASALAEAASLDQLRAAASTIRSSFFNRTGGVTPSSQTSRESSSPRDDTPDDSQTVSLLLDNEPHIEETNSTGFTIQRNVEGLSCIGSGSDDGCQSYALVDSCGSDSDGIDDVVDGATPAMTSERYTGCIDKSIELSVTPPNIIAPNMTTPIVDNQKQDIEISTVVSRKIDMQKLSADNELSNLNAKNECASDLPVDEAALKLMSGRCSGTVDDKTTSDIPPKPPARLGLDTNSSDPDNSQSPSEGVTLSQALEEEMAYETEDDDCDDDDDDEDFDEDEYFDDIVNDDCQDSEEEHRTDGQPKVRFVERTARHSWDDEFVLKREHVAMVPAFDPRPGRINVPQNQDIDIPPKGYQATEKTKGDRVLLALRRQADRGKTVEVSLDNPKATIFSYILSLALMDGQSSGKAERLKRIWDPTYTLVYASSTNESDSTDSQSTSSKIKWETQFVEKNLGTSTLLKSEVVQYLQKNADKSFLRQWRLYGTKKSCRKQRNCSQLLAAYRAFAHSSMNTMSDDQSSTSNDDKQRNVVSHPTQVSHVSQRFPFIAEVAPVEDVLQFLASLQKLSTELDDRSLILDEMVFDVGTEEFLSKKLTNKLTQQLQDPLVVASGSLPLWCDHLVINYPMMFPFEARQLYFQATAFGCTRSVVWLQGMHDAAMQRSRGHTPRRVDGHEFKIGRLKHERAKVPRGDELLSFAQRLMNFHASRKSILEIEFKDEEGTGLGPSLEFYSLVSRELQRRSLGMWMTDDLSHVDKDSEASDSLHEFVVHPNGLFPAPMPQDGEMVESVCELFHFLGILLAKCLQDHRLIDIPLCIPFLKVLCAATTVPSVSPSLLCCPSLPSSPVPISTERDEHGDSGVMCSCWFKESFTDIDFHLVHPEKAKFVLELRSLIEKANNIRNDTSLSEDARQKLLSELQLLTENGHQCALEDLSLTFEYVPSSDVYGFKSVPLKFNGADEILNIDNVEEYVLLLTEFCMHKGIERQLQAFYAGFNRVFPMEKLHAFTPLEVRRVLSGEQTPQWTREDLVNFTEPRYGYTRESSVFKMLVNVLDAMNGEERKEFLQFATGCSSLPPGGLANLHPRLTVVRKSGEGDGSYPSVNTCVHYLKLPEYTTEEALKTKLSHATKEKGFHLN